MSETTLEVAADSRALVITEILELGGAERSLLALARFLHAQGLPVHIVTYTDHANLAQYATHPLPVVQLFPQGGGARRWNALGAYFRQRSAAARKPILSGYQPALHATLAGMRGFHTLMHDTPSLFGDQHRRGLRDHLRIAVSNYLIGRGLRSGGRTFVNSEYLKSESRKDFGVEAEILRMGGWNAGAQAFAPRPVHPGDELRILSVCRIEANKRIEWILDSLAELEQEPEPLSARTPWRLDLAGKGSLLEPLRARAERLALGERVHFLGFVSDEELEALYARAHLFLMPAVQGYGLPAVEAIERGIPVVLHRESGVSDILLSTPWATVFSGGGESLTPALHEAIDCVVRGAHLGTAPPELPTENQWAEAVARRCEWL